MVFEQDCVLKIFFECEEGSTDLHNSHQAEEHISLHIKRYAHQKLENLSELRV